MGCCRGAIKITQQSLVIDASVGVKWFSRKDELDLVQSDLLLETQRYGSLTIWVPDLFFYEVANTLSLKPSLSKETAQVSLKSLLNLGLNVAPVTETLLSHSITLARQAKITVYDACYCVLAAAMKYPLVTANPKHQGKPLGCQVIPLKDWKGIK